MFSKSKINEPSSSGAAGTDTQNAAPAAKPAGEVKATTPKPKPPASILSADLLVTGNIKTTGDVQVEGEIKGDIRAHGPPVKPFRHIESEEKRL